MRDSKSIQRARSAYYGWLGKLFGFLKDANSAEYIAQTLELLATQPLEDKSEQALNNLRNLIEKKGLEALCEENNDIFFSIATTLVPVTASYYDEGRDDGQKRVQMSEFFYRSTFRRDTKTCNEPEDHVSLIFGLNCKLLEQAANGCEGSEALAKEIFVEIINPFIGAFEKALYKHESALFYKEVAVILNAFMAFERFLLHVAEPKYEEPTTKALWQEAKDRKPFVQRVRRNLDEIQL